MKKRAMAALFALVLMVGLVLSPGASASTTMYVYTSNGKSLNLRDYPTTDGNVITTIPFGAKVTVDTGFVGSSCFTTDQAAVRHPDGNQLPVQIHPHRLTVW